MKKTNLLFVPGGFFILIGIIFLVIAFPVITNNPGSVIILGGIVTITIGVGILFLFWGGNIKYQFEKEKIRRRVCGDDLPPRRQWWATPKERNIF